jgi:hypothetical protein
MYSEIAGEDDCEERDAVNHSGGTDQQATEGGAEPLHAASGFLGPVREVVRERCFNIWFRMADPYRRIRLQQVGYGCAEWGDQYD